MNIFRSQAMNPGIINWRSLLLILAVILPLACRRSIETARDCNLARRFLEEPEKVVTLSIFRRSRGPINIYTRDRVCTPLHRSESKPANSALDRAG